MLSFAYWTFFLTCCGDSWIHSENKHFQNRSMWWKGGQHWEHGRVHAPAWFFCMKFPYCICVCVCMRVRGRRGGGLGPQISSSSSFYDPEMYRWMMFTRIIFHFVTPSGLLRKVSGWSEPLKIPAQRPLVFKMNLSVCLTEVLCVCFWPLRMFWF